MKAISILTVGVAVCVMGCASSQRYEISTQWVSHSEMQVKQTIKDRPRREAIIESIRTLDERVREHDRVIQQLRIAIVEGNADYVTSRGELESLNERVRARIKAMADDIEKCHFEVREHVSVEEWEKLMVEPKHLRADQRDRQGLGTMMTRLFLIYGGGDIGQYLTVVDEKIREAMIYQKRREAVLSVTKELSRDMTYELKEYEKRVEGWVSLLKDYDATQEEIDKRFKLLMEQQELLMGYVLDARDKMKSQMREGEWKAVFGEK